MKTGLLLILILAGAAVCAMVFEKPKEIAWGTGVGMLVGGLGYLFGMRILRQHRRGLKGKGAVEEEKKKKKGRWKRRDIWGTWGAGMLVRLALITLFAGLIWRRQGWDFDAAMLSLASVYLILMFWESARLYAVLVSQDEARGMG